MICNEHVRLVKTWLPAQYGGPKAWLDQLVYDNSFQSRTATRKEFLDQVSSTDECEKLYEESSWCPPNHELVEQELMTEPSQKHVKESG